MPSLHQALGGNSAASVQQSPTPAAPPAGGSAAGSLQPLPGEDPQAYFQRTGQRMDPSMYQAMIAPQANLDSTQGSMRKAFGYPSQQQHPSFNSPQASVPAVAQDSAQPDADAMRKVSNSFKSVF